MPLLAPAAQAFFAGRVQTGLLRSFPARAHQFELEAPGSDFREAESVSRAHLQSRRLRLSAILVEP